MNAVKEFFRTFVHTAVAYAWWGQIEFETWFRSGRGTSRPRGRNVLLIVYRLPPAIGSGIFRPASFLRYAATFGWRLSAISGPLDHAGMNGADKDLLGIPGDVDIHRISKTNLRPSWRFFPRIRDDDFCSIFSMYALASGKFAHKPPSAVIASGPLFTSFVAAYFLARLFGAKLALDYRDEWSECPFDFVPEGNCDLQWERRCLRAADAVFFATETIRDLYLNSFPHLNAARCHVLHNGWEPAEFPSPEEASERSSGPGRRLTLSYVGHTGLHALPGDFLAVLTEVLTRNGELRDRMRVRFVGRKSEEAFEQFADFETHMPGVLDLAEHVPKREAVRMMCESSALLLLNPPGTDRLTGKIFDYLASGQPLLVYGHGGEIGRLMRELKAGVMVPVDDPEALEHALVKLQSNPASEWSTPAREAFLKTHTREALAKTMFKVLEGL